MTCGVSAIRATVLQDLPEDSALSSHVCSGRVTPASGIAARKLEIRDDDVAASCRAAGAAQASEDHRLMFTDSEGYIEIAQLLRDSVSNGSIWPVSDPPATCQLKQCCRRFQAQPSVHVKAIPDPRSTAPAHIFATTRTAATRSEAAQSMVRGETCVACDSRLLEVRNEVGSVLRLLEASEDLCSTPHRGVSATSAAHRCHRCLRSGRRWCEHRCVPSWCPECTSSGSGGTRRGARRPR